jgi:peptidoglycan hydrolase-like protein with peptidoglycan-binding domain
MNSTITDAPTTNANAIQPDPQPAEVPAPVRGLLDPTAAANAFAARGEAGASMTRVNPANDPRSGGSGLLNGVLAARTGATAANPPQITGSVGPNGDNNEADVRIVQQLLNQHRDSPIGVDGDFGDETEQAIVDFQRDVVHMQNPDGEIDPGGPTFKALVGATDGQRQPSPIDTGDLPPINPNRPGLTNDDFARAARELKLFKPDGSPDVALIHAVANIEAPRSGYLPSGRPTILFEAASFYKLTGGRFGVSNISSPTWNRSLYKGGEAEYPRLAQAMALDRTSALKSASWGAFQIMGFNYQSAGFASVEDFVKAMYESEGNQLEAFIHFLQHSGLVDALRDKRWADFARGYNGPGFAENQYDVKLAAAYQRFSAMPATALA